MAGQIPTQENLYDILIGLKGLSSDENKAPNKQIGLIPFTQELVKQIESVGKIKTENLKQGLKNTQVINTAISGFAKSLNDIAKNLYSMLDGIDTNKLQELNHMLISTESAQADLITKETKNENGGFEREYLMLKSPGVIDAIMGICGLAETMGKLKAPNFIKFKANFFVTTRLFKYSFKKISEIVDQFDGEKMKHVKEGVEGLQMIMSELPMSLDLMVDMWSKQAKKALLIDRGIYVVLGKDYVKGKKVKGGGRVKSQEVGGALGALVKMGEILYVYKDAELNPSTFETFKKTTQSASMSLFILTNTLALLVVPGALAWLSAIILFGNGKEKKGDGTRDGLMGFVIRGLIRINNYSKDLKQVDKNIIILVATIGMIALVALALAATAALMTLVALPSLVVVGLCMLGVVAMFFLIGWLAQKVLIDLKIGWDIFLIVATVGLLALVAVAIAVLGQFVKEVAWSAIWQILLYMGGVTLMFIGVSFASRIAGEASKQMLWMVACVGLLALIAVALIYIGNEVEVNWSGIISITLMMGVVTAMMIGIAFAAKFIEQGKVALIIMVGCITALCASMYMLSKVAQDTDMNKLWETVGVMGVIVAAIVAITWGLGASISGPQALIFLAGVGAIASITAIISGLAGTMKEIANVVKLYEEANIDASNVGDITEKLALPILAVIGDGKENPGIIKYFTKYSKGTLKLVKRKTRILSSIVSHIGKMASTLQQIASLNIPIGWDANGNPNKFVKMDSKDFLNASLNTASILHFFTALFDDSQSPWTLDVFGGSITISPIKEDYLKKIKGSTKRKIDRLAEIVGFVGNMANTIQKLASLSVPDPSHGYDENGRPKGYIKMTSTHFEEASQNVATILTNLISGIGDDNFTKTLESLNKRALKNMDLAMEPMKAISGIVDAIQMLAGGEYVKTWKTNEEGNRVPDQYESFKTLLEDEASSQSVQNNLLKVMSIVVGAMASFSTNEDYKKMLKSAKESSKNLSEVIKTSTNILKGIVDFYNKDLVKLDTKDFHAKFSALSIQTNNIIKNLGGVSMNLSNAKQLQSNIKETTTLLSKINSVDTNKLKYAYSLMSSISKLSQSINGNFKGLAKAINEELVSALEELQKVLDEINTNGISTKSSSSSSESISTIANNSKNGQATKDTANQTKEPQGNAKNDAQLLQSQLDTLDAIKETITALIDRQQKAIKVVATNSSYSGQRS